MQFLRLDMLMFTCPDCIFSFYYIIRLFWSKTGNDTAIYFKRVYTSEGDTPGKPNNKRSRISRLTNIKYSMTSLTTLKHCIFLMGQYVNG